MPGLDLFQEADRQLTICNACRYCEGFCAAFRAMEKRRAFTREDILYLSNLCHDCRACYYACMFTPPHEFAINIPQVMSEVRLESYGRWSWPRTLARSFSNQGIGLTLAGIIAAIVVATSFLLISPSKMFTAHTGPGAFYEIVSYLAMVIPAVALFFYWAAIWLRGLNRSWKESGNNGNRKIGFHELAAATVSALGLRYLGGGGPGCTYPDEHPSEVRRVYHSFTFWGFLLAFASTTAAFIYQDILHRLPPYPLVSIPVVLGALGGVGLIVGTAGLIWLKWKSDRSPAVSRAYSIDYTFLAILGLTALTGMLTLTLRSTSALGTLLVVHLALVAALFVTAPYGKFVHLVYRSVALVRYELEQSRPHQS